MQLVEIDLVEAKSLQAAFHCLAQVRWAGIVGPLVRPRAIPSTFGRNDKFLGVRRECFGDQFFADIGTIGISSIDEVDSQFNGSAENGYRHLAILRWTPDSFAGKAHGSETKAIDSEFTAEFDCSGCSGRQTCCFLDAHFHGSLSISAFIPRGANRKRAI